MWITDLFVHIETEVLQLISENYKSIFYLEKNVCIISQEPPCSTDLLSCTSKLQQLLMVNYTVFQSNAS